MERLKAFGLRAQPVARALGAGSRAWVGSCTCKKETKPTQPLRALLVPSRLAYAMFPACVANKTFRPTSAACSSYSFLPEAQLVMFSFDGLGRHCGYSMKLDNLYYGLRKARRGPTYAISAAVTVYIQMRAKE